MNTWEIENGQKWFQSVTRVVWEEAGSNLPPQLIGWALIAFTELYLVIFSNFHSPYGASHNA